MAGRSKSTLFLMEQLVVIAVFAICAAVCVYILVISHLMTVDSVDTRNALLVAESAAESYKAFNGDTGRVAEVLFDNNLGQFFPDGVVVYYCSDWRPASEALAAFVLRLEKGDVVSSVQLADITVSRILTDDELVNLTVGVRRTGQ